MNTLPSHLVINAAIEKKYGRKLGFVPSAFLWGSVLPDMPLGLLSIGYFIYRRYLVIQPAPGIMNNAFDNLYFNNPWWIASHNFLHSPTALSIYAIFLWRFRNNPNTRGGWWLTFVLGCMIHSVIDIFTHFNDGPVLFWPFEWHIRFRSPVSYWDKAHGASQFFWVEMGINVMLIGYLFLPKLIQRFKKGA